MCSDSYEPEYPESKANDICSECGNDIFKNEKGESFTVYSSCSYSRDVCQTCGYGSCDQSC